MCLGFQSPTEIADKHIAWPLITHFSCPEDTTPRTCPSGENMGWRYQCILIGGLTFVLVVIRVFFMKMEESPKWLVTHGEYDDAIAALKEISESNRRQLHVTSADFIRLSRDQTADASVGRAVHLRGLFATRTLARSTCGQFVIWWCIGIAKVCQLPAIYMTETSQISYLHVVPAGISG